MKDETGQLPFDCCRCAGVISDQGKLVAPCDSCRRAVWRSPSGDRTSWFSVPPKQGSDCPSYWSVK